MKRLSITTLALFLGLAGMAPAAFANPEQESDKVKTISRGEAVDLKKHLAKGQYTLVEFYADW